MQGFLLDYTPENPDLFLLVKIQLKDIHQGPIFEQNGVKLLKVFEDETDFNLVLSGTTDDVGDQKEHVYFNLWRFRRERFASKEIAKDAKLTDLAKEPAIGGTRDLLPAMAKVHDIREYGPVDDLVRLETQNIVCSFLVDDSDPPALAQDRGEYYLLVEYDISSGEAGTFAFDLRAYLGDFQREQGWDCITTCFPMTGALSRYVQFFRLGGGDSPAKTLAHVDSVLKKVPWSSKPMRRYLLRKTAYDRTAQGEALVRPERRLSRRALRLAGGPFRARHGGEE